MASKGTLVIRFIGDLKEFDRSLKTLEGRLGSAGSKLTKGVTLPVLGLGAAAFKASKDFNGAMSNIATLIPGATGRVDELKSSIQDMAVKTGVATGDLADGMYQVISAFGDSADSVKILETNARAARAGVATTTDAINLTSAVTKAYGDTSAKAVRQVSDLALMTVRLGQTTFPELASSMGKVTPIAQSMNQSQEELFATFATLTGVTGTAAEVSTQYRGVLAGLINPTQSMKDLLEQHGFATGKAALEQQGLVKTMQMIVKASESSGKPITQYISSIEAVPAALALAGPQAKKYQQALKGMAGAAGTTDVAFKEATTGVNEAGFAYDQAVQKGMVFLQQLGDGLAPAMIAFFDAAQPTVDMVGDLATKFANADPATQKMVVSIGLAAAALGPLLLVTSKMIGAVRTIIPLFVTQSMVQGKATTTAGPLSKALKFVATSAWVAIRAVSSWILTLLRVVVQQTVAVVQIMASWTLLAAKAAFTAVRVVAAWALMGARAMASALRMAAAWVVAMGPVGWVIAAVIGLVVVIAKNWDKIKALTAKAWAWMSSKVAAGWRKIVGATTRLGGQMLAFVRALPGKLVSYFLNWTLAGVIIRHWDRAKSGAVRVATSLLSWVSRFPGRLVNNLGDLGDLLYDKGSDLVSGLWEGIKDKGDWLKDQLIGFVKDKIPGPIAKALGISSPSKVMADLARWIPAGMAVGMDAGSRDVMRAADRMALAAVPQLRSSAAPMRPQFPGAAGSGAATGGGGGLHVEHLEVKAFSDRFDLRQVQDQLALRGAV